MKFADLLNKVSNLPAFTVKFLAAGENLAQVRLQISRWVKDGRVIRLHKGLYTLSDPYRKVACEPFFVANMLKQASYVSLHSALAWYGLIPEFVPVVTSITTGRPQTIDTPAGRFEFRHISKKYFWGYRQVEIAAGNAAFIAYPEKALLDLVYMSPCGEDIGFLEELRFQNFEQIDQERLDEFAERFNSPKLNKALKNIKIIINEGEGIEL
jgi:predicted transcriptional regulator of viral defense system